MVRYAFSSPKYRKIGNKIENGVNVDGKKQNTSDGFREADTYELSKAQRGSGNAESDRSPERFLSDRKSVV